MTQPIFLVGPPAVETTVGPELARACQRHFVDTDHWLQTQAGQNHRGYRRKRGLESSQP